MSSSNTSLEGDTSLRLLSIDGGGIRGLSSLIILKYLMKRLSPKDQKPLKPCEYFHLIGGTSTGGLIALMLGRLRMDVDTCIDKYIQLSSTAFQPKRSKAKIFSKTKDFVEAKGSYDGNRLATEVKKIVESIEDSEDASLVHPDVDCRVFVCAFTKRLFTPVLFRSYKTDDAVDALSIVDCAIWQAARATSAAATFFDPIKIGLQEYIDGGTGYNNPVEVVLDEAKSIWKDWDSRVQCLVSIGTGVPNLRDFGDNLKEVIKTLKDIATETERTEQRFFKNTEFSALSSRYFRFNVDKGLGDVALDEHEKLDQIEAATEMYLGDPRVRKEVEKLASIRALGNEPITAEDRDKYLKWLPYNDPLEYHNMARQYRTTQSTGDWFLKGEFGELKEGRSPFLWLHAKAGSGKTVLASAAIDKIESQRLGTLAYFYFSFQSKAAQDLRAFKCTLLTQIVKSLVTEVPHKPNMFMIPKAFQQLYKSYYPSLNPKEEDLDTAFYAVLGGSERTYIVVDALDECASEEQRTHIITFLTGLVTRVGCNVSVLLVSRPEEDIERALSNAPGQKLIVPFDVDKVNQDIRRHLQNQIAKYPYKEWTDNIKAEVINHLVGLADGVFRWADLQFRDLKGKARSKDVKRALQQLPKNLEETYKRMLERIDAQYHLQAVSVLRWLAYSSRPLLLAEISEIAAFESDLNDDKLDEYGVADVTFSTEDRFNNVFWVRRILGGLVTIASIDDAEEFNVATVLSEPQRNTQVSLAHFTVKEYLESKKDSPPMFHLTPQVGHWFIVKSCIAYILSYDKTEAAEKTEEIPYPLLLFAIKYSRRHFAQVCETLKEPMEQGNINVKLASLLEELEGPAFQLSKLSATEPDEEGLAGTTPDHTLHLSSAVLPRGPGFDIESANALHIAAGHGDIKLASILLDAGTQINQRDQFQQTALHSAARNGQLDMTRELLSRACKVDVSDKSSRTPLSYAAEQGHTDLVGLLLQHGADKGLIVDSREHKQGAEALSIMPPETIFGYGRVKVLTGGQYTDPISYRVGDDWTPLHFAARRGHTDTVKLLLNGGDDPRRPDFWDGDPLSIATAHGHDGVVQVLLEHGASVSLNIGLLQQYNYVHVAAVNWQCSALDKLLQAGADVDKVDGGDHGWTALHYAAIGIAGMVADIDRHENTQLGLRVGSGAECVRVLLEGGANIAMTDARGCTPLHLAARGGHLDIVDAILARGADIDIVDHASITPLGHAAMKNRLDVAKFLIDHDASVDGISPCKWPPLYLAASFGHTDMVTLLLDHNCSIDAGLDNGWTSLHIAAAQSFADVVRTLVERGANPGWKTDGGWTPLIAAARNGCLETVQVLVGKASMEETDMDGRTALHAAAARKSQEVYKFLVREGANAQREDKNGVTPAGLIENGEEEE